MERLNDIMARTTRRQQAFEERLSQGQGTAPQGQAQRPGSSMVRRPLSEQTARLGQQNSRASQLRNQHNPLLKTRDEQARPTPPLPAPRPAYPLQRPQSHELDRSATSPSLRMRHPSMIQADVQEEWEDDTAGMRYGDWENDENDVQVGQTYMRPKAAPLARASHPLITRDLQDAQALPPRLPSPQAPPQEVRRPSHRLTQPLTPQALARMNQELPQETPRVQQSMPTRQVVVSEQTASQLPAISLGICPICKGAGYLRVDVPYGHPNFGKPIPCECKEAERKEKRRRQLREMSNLDAFRDKNFKNFNPRVPGVQEAYQVALEYAQNPQGWLVFIGKNGCGKTHLAAAIANQHLARGSLVLFAIVPELLDHLRATFAPSSTVVYDQLFSTMREAELLILDDLGSEQNSPWACEKLFQLLNYRYNSRFPTIITTNNLGLQAVDERIRSRLLDKSLVTEITFDRAKDYRPNNPRRD